MNLFLTVSAILLFAAAATAQPMVISNGRITYAAGASYVDAQGITRICSSQLVMEQMSNGSMRKACADKPSISAADAYSNMTPAAGGPQRLSDRNLPSDATSRLPNDREIDSLR